MTTMLIHSGTGAAPTPAPEPHRGPFAWRPIAAVVVARAVFLLAFAGRYGWHRDELYYFAAGKHLAFGYVDFPPVAALVSASARWMFGASLVGQRSMAIAAGCGVTVLAAAIARQLGGGRRAQVLAAVAVGCGPLLLGGNELFQTVALDQLAWAAMFLAALRVAERPTLGRWAALGTIVGVALETKYTILMPLATLTFGAVVFARRGASRTAVDRRGPWLAAMIAAALFAPNVAWQVQHHWASVAFYMGRNAGNRADDPPPQFLLELLLLLGPFGVWLAVKGVRDLWRRAATRAFAIAAPLVIVGFLAAGGKSYYAAPIIVLVVPAGAVAWERHTRHPVLVPVLAVAVLLPILPVGVPVLPERTMLALHLDEARPDYAEEIGWPQLADTVAAAYRALPASQHATTAILASNYGEAGAIDLYGPVRGLPHAASGDLSYALWSRPRGRATTAIAVGFDRRWLDERCRDHTIVAVFHSREHVHQDESGTLIARCDLRGTVDGAIGRGWGW